MTLKSLYDMISSSSPALPINSPLTLQACWSSKVLALHAGPFPAGPLHMLPPLSGNFPILYISDPDSFPQRSLFRIPSVGHTLEYTLKDKYLFP